VILSRGRLIMLDIGLGNDADAQAAIDKLIADFAGHPALPEALNGVADKYRILQRHKQARELYQYIVDNFPESEYVILSRGGMIMADIGLGNDANAQAALDRLIADFSEHPSLPREIFDGIGQAYYGEARQGKGDEYYRKAIAVWERIIKELPSSPITPQSYYAAAVCYSQELGEYQKGIEYYQAIVDNWPNYEYAWHAQFFVGKYYEKLRNSDAVPESEANPKIEQAYQAVIEKYPNSKSGPYAALKLGQMSFQKGRWVEAAMYFELLLQKYPEDKRHSYVLYYLGQTYEKMGQLAPAIAVYRQFINTADPTEPRIEGVKAKIEELGGYNK